MLCSGKELRPENRKYKVWFDTNEANGLPTQPWRQFVLTDRSTESIVIGFVNGKKIIHNNLANVLTNSQTCDWQSLNVRNYLSLSDQGSTLLMVNG